MLLQHSVQLHAAVAGDGDGVLLGLGLLVVVHRANDELIPIFIAAFVDDFIEHVVQVVDRVYDFAEIGGLIAAHLGVVNVHHRVPVFIAIKLLNVVVHIVIVAAEDIVLVVAAVRPLAGERLEQHDRCIDAPVARLIRRPRMRSK